MKPHWFVHTIALSLNINNQLNTSGKCAQTKYCVHKCAKKNKKILCA